MPEIPVASAVGAAHNATIEVVNEVGPLEEALVAARAKEVAERPLRAVQAAERAVAKAEQQLVWAKEALAQAKKENG